MSSSSTSSSSITSSSSLQEEFPELSYFGKTLNGTFVLVYNKSLFYKKQGQNIVKYCDNVQKVEVFNNSVILLYNQNNWTESLDLIVLKENFSDSKKVFVKDKAFDVDDVNNYLKYSKRTIKDFYISENELFVLFENEFKDVSSSSYSLESFSSYSSKQSSSSALESSISSSSSSADDIVIGYEQSSGSGSGSSANPLYDENGHWIGGWLPKV